MKLVTVAASQKYDILIGQNLLSQCGNYIKKAMPLCTAAIITDDIVNTLYSAQAENSLTDAGFRTVKYVFKNGEGSKNLSVLGEILEFLAQNNVTKSDLIIALGGGVTGDMAGFAASCYLRGIPYVQIPTTFLAAIDSSVGGKTAVNLAKGKNLVGAFYQPILVLCDTNIISALPDAVFLNGVAEAVKYGVISDTLLFDHLLKSSPRENLEDTIYRCAASKAQIVGCDEYDTGVRQLLNLGHTVGHAVEKCSDFLVPHGQAVAIGMAVIARAAVKRGLSEESCLSAIINTLKKNGLPVACDYSAKMLADAACSDKKRSGGFITLVIPRNIGDCFLYKINISELSGFIADGLGE